ncbi:calcium-binding protein [Isoptericola sp. 178]|uniref:calcium-binding protein n=1 Tax=Isoptericola sp. 178 TaxID=3064651 RepID=UPI0027140318|nr:calcium-binding protein [Isoptericola sp. 178]MDO8145653.1 calcium-binding protein [Isoptericola sp. 178]
MRRLRESAGIGIVTAAAVTATVLVAPPAYADPVDDFAEDVAAWALGFAEQEVWATPLPVVNVSPAQVLADADTGFGNDLSALGGGRYRLEVSQDVPAAFSLEPGFPLSSGPGEVTVAVSVGLEFTVGSEEVGGTDEYFVVATGADAPELFATVDLDGFGGAVATSVGLVGGQITSDDVALHATYGGTLDDPDGDGRLAFAGTDGTPGDGELSVDGSAVGLSTVELTSSSASGNLTVTTEAGYVPAVAGGIAFTWTDLSDAATLSVTPDADFDVLGDFLNMSQRDVAEGLVLLKSTVVAMQRTPDNVDLPFMRGTAADAVHLAENLTTFLTDEIPQEGDDAGIPSWTSLEELFTAINASGTGLGVAVADYDATNHRLPFTLTFTRSDEGPGDLFVPTPGAEEAGVKTGLVELGNLLTAPGGQQVTGANEPEQTPGAQTTRDYSVEIELALDLQDPVVFDEPQPQTGPDGEVVAYYDEAPIGIDRMLFRSATASASFPITASFTTAGQIGFVGVEVDGSLAVGPETGGDPMLTLALGGTEYRTLGEVMDEITAVPSGVTAAVDLHVTGSGQVDVPLEGRSFSSDGGAATFSVDCDVTQIPDSCTPTIESGLTDLLALDVDTDDPLAMLGRLLTVLTLFDAGLRSTDLLGDTADVSLPLVDTSIGDVLTGASDGLATATELSAVLEEVSTTPPENLQDLLGLLEDAIGADLPVELTEVDGTPALVLDVAVARSYQTSAPLSFDLGDVPLVSANADAEVDLSAEVDASAGLAVSLGTPFEDAGDAATLRVVDPNVTASASGSVDGQFAVSVAGLSAQLGDGGTLGAVGLTGSYGASGAVGLGDLLGGDLSLTGTDDCSGGPRLLCVDAPVSVVGTSLGTLSVTQDLPGDGTLSGGEALPAPDIDLPDDLGDLTALLYDSELDLLALPESLLTYLGIVSEALQTLSGGGNFPLIGQQLADAATTLEDARTEIEQLVEDTDAALETGYADAKATLESAPGVTLSEYCGLLEPATGLSVSAVDTVTADTTYTYAIVAHNADGDPTGWSGTDSVDNDAALAAEGPRNELTWTENPRATGYYVVRSTDGGTTWEQISDVAGASYVDDGTGTPSAAPDDPAEADYPQADCTANVRAIDTIVLEWAYDPGSGGDAGAPEFSETVPLDLGIPGLALRASAADGAGGVGVSLDYGFRVRLALDKESGVVLLTDNGDDDVPEGYAVATARLEDAGSDPDLQAELAVLQVTADKKDAASDELQAELSIDLTGTPDAITIDGEDLEALPVADLVSSPRDHVDLAASFDIDVFWALAAAPEMDGQTLPGIATDFCLRWSVGWESGGGGGGGGSGSECEAPDDAGTYAPTFGNASNGVVGTPSIAFTDIGLDLGQFLSGQIKPAIDTINQAIDPLRPIIDTLYAPIPVLTDLSQAAGGPEISLVTLAELYSTLAGGTDVTAVKTILQIVETANTVDDLLSSAAPEDGGVILPIGDLALDGAAAKTTAATPDQLEKLKASYAAGPAPTGGAAQVVADLSPTNITTAGFDSERYGFTFTFLEQPEQVANLLVGGDVEIVRFDSGPLKLGFSMKQSFGPVYAPPPVLITLSGSAGVEARIIAGLDTYGLRKAVEAWRDGTGVGVLDALDSLYFATTDLDGKPVPVLTFYGELAAGVAVSLVVIEVSLTGGVGLTISFFWNDPNDDGKFRLSEIGEQVKRSPICLFTMSGRVYLFLRLGITLGVSIFSVSFTQTIADITLLDFSAEPDCEPPPPTLGAVDEVDGTDYLVVYAGRLGVDGKRGDSAWDAHEDPEDDAEVFTVIERHDYSAGTEPEGGWPVVGYTVQWSGFTSSFDGEVDRVLLDGQGKQTPLQVSFVGDSEAPPPGDDPGDVGSEVAAGFRTAVVVRGSEADDVIRTDIGPAWVDARGGDDKVVTANPDGVTVRVSGGADDDTIGTAQGRAFVAGDTTLDATVATVDGVEVAVALGDPGEQDGGGDDTVNVGLNRNVVWGNGGDDVIGVVGEQGADRGGATNLLAGGHGADRITAGPGDDIVFTGQRADLPFGANADVTIQGEAYTPGSALSAAQLGALADGDGRPDSVDDPAQANNVDTGAGNDLVIGSTVRDVVQAGSLGSPPPQRAYLFGGADEDILSGGFGGDWVFGGPDDDYVLAEPHELSFGTGDDGFGPDHEVTRLPLPEDAVPQEDVLVGGADRDHVVGGDGGAQAWGDAYRPGELCVAGDPVASDSDMPDADEPGAPNAADDDDLILGGIGVDVVRAGGGADRLELRAADDRGCGQSGTDTVFAGAGADQVWGGSAKDVVHGESGPDLLYGNAGPDVIYGHGEEDVAEGNAGSDVVSGGGADDMLVGGTRAAGRADTDDRVFGDAGADVIAGDNMTIERAAPGAPGAPVLAGRDTADRVLVEHETGSSPPASTSGPDRLYGGADDDAIFGQGAGDTLWGGPEDDLTIGGRGEDTVFGEAGRDDVVGGSVTPLGTGEPGGAGTEGQPDDGDTLRGGSEGDVMLGDNGVVTVAADGAVTPLLLGRDRGTTEPRTIRLLDLGVAADGDDAGDDWLRGDGDEDVLLGQADPDRLDGGGADDAVEGGPGVDWVEGGPGDDDLVGGSTTPAATPSSDEPGTGTGASTGQGDDGDLLFGETGDDAILGDDGTILRGEGATTSVLVRSSTDGSLVQQRSVVPYDLASAQGGADLVSGGNGVDLVWGQDGGDALSGGPHDDYVEGNGAADVIRGDALVVEIVGDEAAALGHSVPVPSGLWRGTPSVLAETGPDGQDDLIGGSAIAGHRDAGDVVSGNGEHDVVLGDNGTLLRDPVEDTGSWADRVEPDRYPADTGDPAYPDRLFTVRLHDPDALPAGHDGVTRFCTEDQDTCEPAGAFGDDTIDGDAGDDRLWSQDGDDTVHGDAGSDDVIGGLGDDELFGDGGQDTILGDRGGIVGQWIDTTEEGTFTVSVKGVPDESYTGLRPGTFDRRVDLFSDVEDRAWVDTADAPMPHPGETVGGADRIRGGADRDVVFGAAGDDLANGDDGGDSVFGGADSDVLWGGRGLADGSPDRGDEDQYVDLVFGGESVPGSGTDSVVGADILDWKPRGSVDDPGVTCTLADTPQGTLGEVVDPCAWFTMTNTDDGDVTNDQHHHGTDWIYGGRDRDVMQGNESANGPSDQDDRLIDWNGAFNLYSHCNAAYGGWNDIRQHSPSMKAFLQGVAYGAGAGRTPDEAADDGTSAYLELAIVEPGEKEHGSGSAFPTTPGHFDSPAACDAP